VQRCPMHLAAQLLNEPPKKTNSQTQPAAVDWNALVKLLKFDCFILFYIVSYCFIIIHVFLCLCFMSTIYHICPPSIWSIVNVPTAGAKVLPDLDRCDTCQARA
jgi:hypothetical protein